MHVQPPPCADTAHDLQTILTEDFRALLKVSKPTFQLLRKDPRFPRPVVNRPRLIRWRLGDVRRWMDQQAATSRESVNTEVANGQ